MANSISRVSGVRYIEGIGTQILLDTYYYGTDVPGGAIACACEVTVLPGDSAVDIRNKMAAVVREDATNLYNLSIAVNAAILPTFQKG